MTEGGGVKRKLKKQKSGVRNRDHSLKKPESEEKEKVYRGSWRGKT